MNALIKPKPELDDEVDIQVARIEDFIVVRVKTIRRSDEPLKEREVAKYIMRDCSWQSEYGADFDDVLQSLPDILKQLLETP